MKKTNNLVAVIMAGGRGERFWPKSRRALPKQLLPIAGSRTMLQETVNRIKTLIPEKNIYIATGVDLAKKVKQQLPSLPVKNIISEPMGRNTAACIGLAAVRVEKQHPGATMVILPADHLIKEKTKFLNILKNGIKAAESGHLVTLGIQPIRPDTGYGYIKVKNKKLQVKSNMYKVEKFVEKPNRRKAEKFLAAGNYYWNSGMFIWTTKSILEAMEEHMPVLSKGLVTISKAIGTAREREVTRKVFQKLERISIDYGIMEKANNVVMAKAEISWDDVGSWLAMERIYSHDNQGNVTIGQLESIDSRNCIVVSDKHLVATLGVSDLIIVTTPDTTLICSKDKAGQIKKLVQQLSADKKRAGYL